MMKSLSYFFFLAVLVLLFAVVKKFGLTNRHLECFSSQVSNLPAGDAAV